jgi:hypothetical protein
MDNKKESVEQTANPQDQQHSDILQNRIPLSKVEIDTPALLNLIKHCQDNRELATTIEGHFKNGVHGILAGILKKEIDEDNLFITSA